MTGIIPAEVDSEIKFSKNISQQALIIIVGTFFSLQCLVTLVHPILQMWYLLFALLLGVFLIIPGGKHNPGKRMFHCVLYSFIKKRSVYFSIDREEALAFYDKVH